MDRALISKRLKELRKKKGLSHEKLSAILADRYSVTVGKQTLINYEKGSDKEQYVSESVRKQIIAVEGMSVKKLNTFADLYGVSTDYLLGRTETPTPDTTKRAIVEYTGLSDNAVLFLNNNKKNKRYAKLFERFAKIIIESINE